MEEEEEKYTLVRISYSICLTHLAHENICAGLHIPFHLFQVLTELAEKKKMEMEKKAKKGKNEEKKEKMKEKPSQKTGKKVRFLGVKILRSY